MTNTPTIPSTAGMLTTGDRFSMCTASTIFKVEDISQNPMDEDLVAITVTTWCGEDHGTQIFQMDFDHELVRWVA